MESQPIRIPKAISDADSFLSSSFSQIFRVFHNFSEIFESQVVWVGQAESNIEGLIQPRTEFIVHLTSLRFSRRKFHFKGKSEVSSAHGINFMGKKLYTASPICCGIRYYRFPTPFFQALENLESRICYYAFVFICFFIYTVHQGYCCIFRSQKVSTKP